MTFTFVSTSKVFYFCRFMVGKVNKNIDKFNSVVALNR